MAGLQRRPICRSAHAGVARLLARQGLAQTAWSAGSLTLPGPLLLSQLSGIAFPTCCVRVHACLRHLQTLPTQNSYPRTAYTILSEHTCSLNVRTVLTRRRVHGKALLVTFGSNNDAQQAAVESLTREIQASFKKLDGDIRSLGAGAGSAEDAAVQTQLQRQAAQALFKLSVEFRKEETRFLNKVEAQKGLAKGSSIGLIEDDAKPGLAAASDALSTQAQVAMVDMSVHLIEQRDQEIRKIVETIMELGQIMKDLSTLVVEQGTMLDRIDANLQDVSAKVEAGVEQIQAANKTQKESGALTCILGLVVAIIIMLIVVIIRRT